MTGTRKTLGWILLGLGCSASGALAQIPGKFSATGNMTAPRVGHSATILADGRVLIAGGRGASDLLSSAEIYDPATGTFAPTGSMLTPRINHGATRLPDGRVLIFGGFGGVYDSPYLPYATYLALDSAELYDPSTGTFSSAGSMVGPGFLLAGTSIRNGKVWIVGIDLSHFDGYPVFFYWGVSRAEVFDPATNTFTDAGWDPAAPTEIPEAAVALADGRVLIASDVGNRVYDPATDAFSAASGGFAASDGTPLFYIATTTLADGKVLFAGGDDEGGGELDFGVTPFQTTGLFDPQTGTLSAIGLLNQARSRHTATLLGDQSVLITGGFSRAANSLASVESYDPSTGIFRLAGQMTSPRGAHTATLLQDGRVLIAGGSGQLNRTLSSAELYVPSWWAGPIPRIGIDQTSVSLTTVTGQVATQALAIGNAGGGDLNWSVATTVPWLSATPNNGTNAGTVMFTASAANLSVGTYYGSATILGAAANSPMIIPVTFTVSTCMYSVNPGGQAFPAAGGTGMINIQVADSCPWSISNSPNWVTLSGATSRSGAGTATFQVMPNPGAARSGTVSIAGLSFAVEQQSALITGLTLSGSAAQIAFAGDWNTTLTLINTGNSTANVRLNFFDDNGNPLAVPLVFPQSLFGPLLATTLDRTIEPNATLVIDTAGLQSNSVQAGSLQLFTDGTVSSYSLYRWSLYNEEAAAPMETHNAGTYLVPFDNTNGTLNGEAIANLAPQGFAIPILIRDDSGAILRSTSIPLSANGHIAFLLSAVFPESANRRGTIEFDTPVGGRISAAGTKFTLSGAFSTVPTIAK